MIEEVSAGSVVFFDSPDGKLEYLVLHYPAGHWDFPKGAIEKGETELQAAAREVMEETGIKIESFVPNFRKVIEYRYRKKEGLSHKQVIFFLAKALTKNVTLSFEHSGYQWLDFARAVKRLTFENARNVLREANDFLTKEARIRGSS
jgi:bis(5'-nucleosidyl)-tetraphosphatase